MVFAHAETEKMCLELAVQILMSVAVTKNTNMVHLVRGYLPTDTKEPCTSAREVPQDVPVRVPEECFCKKKKPVHTTD